MGWRTSGQHSVEHNIYDSDTLKDKKGWIDFLAGTVMGSSSGPPQNCSEYTREAEDTIIDVLILLKL